MATLVLNNSEKLVYSDIGLFKPEATSRAKNNRNVA